MDCAQRLHEAAGDADLILIEGVMGLFDGSPSAADLARHFGVPVLAVVDASAMAGTFGALAFGLQHYRPGQPWAGVLANRVASERHAQMLQAALPAGDGRDEKVLAVGERDREPGEQVFADVGKHHQRQCPAQAVEPARNGLPDAPQPGAARKPGHAEARQHLGVGHDQPQVPQQRPAR